MFAPITNVMEYMTMKKRLLSGTKTYVLHLFLIFLVCGAMVPVSWGQQVLMPLSGTQGAENINDGVGHYHQRNWNSAIGHFQAALKKNPNSAVAHYNLGLALKQTGQQTQATHHFQMASQFGATNPFIQSSSEVKHALSQKAR